MPALLCVPVGPICLLWYHAIIDTPLHGRGPSEGGAGGSKTTARYLSDAVVSALLEVL